MSSLAHSLKVKIATSVVGCCAMIAGAVTPGIAAPFPTLPAGYKALGTYTNVVTVGDSVACIITCTNLDATKSANMQYDYLQYNGTLVGTENSVVISPGQTHATGVSTLNPGNSAYFGLDENEILTQDLSPGAVRIAVKGTNKVICELQSMDTTTNPPKFLHAPRQFTGAGKR